MIEIHLPEPALRKPARQRVAGSGFTCVQHRRYLPLPSRCRAICFLRRGTVQMLLCYRLDR